MSAKHAPGPLDQAALKRLQLWGPAEDGPNNRLVRAAYTSYDKHCGPRAVECAEKDLLGEALALARRVHKHGCTGVADVGSDCGKCFSCQACAVLAKAGGK